MYEVLFRINQEKRSFYYETKEDAMSMAGFCKRYAGHMQFLGDSSNVLVICPDGYVITNIPDTYEIVENN